jgi:CheY-like chemotaxis protein
MTKYVLDVGNCPPDHSAIRRLIESNFDAKVLQAHHLQDTLSTLQQQQVTLVLVNRKLDQDYSDGMRIVDQIKQVPEWSEIPVMLVTNYEEHQELAIKKGAVRGFGKLSLGSAETRENLKQYLE